MEIQQQIIEYLRESRYFPTAINDIAKATGKRDNFLIPVLTELVKSKVLIEIETENYYPADNIIFLEEKIVSVLANFHKNYPYLQGMKKSDIRKSINHKKGQNNVHEQLFETAVNNLCRKGQLLCSDCYYKLQGKNIETDSQFQRNIEVILNYFNHRQDLNRICLLSDLACNLKVDSRHLRNIMEALLKDGRIIKLYDNMYLGCEHLAKLQNLVINHIRKNGCITTLEAKELFKGARKITIAILELMDEKGITKRDENNRVLC